MNLEFAEIRNINKLCNLENKGSNNENVPLNVNIPYYQRPYKWDKTRIDKLIDDFYENEDSDDEKEGYFAGTVVMVKGESGRFEVVDGQQRITTLFLLNYLRFILIRGHIELIIKTKRMSQLIPKFNEMISAAVNLFDKGRIEKLGEIGKKIEAFTAGIEEQSDEGGSGEKERIWDELLEYYEKEMCLPERNFTNIENYKKESFMADKKFLSGVELTLKYSRSSYNEQLKEALSRVVILMQEDSNPRFDVLSYDKNSASKSAVTVQYMNAMSIIYDKLVGAYITGDEKPVEHIVALENIMKKILENINFCVVVTGREKDAYTLFEVLNDRNFPIEDLELIKNLFYKYYCKKNENDESTDEYIEKADTKWGKIFSDVTGKKEQSKLISYLAAQYFTADGRLKYNDNEKYREAIEKEYLNKKQHYDGKSLLNDICIYEMLSIILDEFDFKYQKKAENVIKAERENAKSITYKALNLFNALKLYGVIPAVTNIIIKKFLEKHKLDELGTDGYIKVFRGYVQGIKNDSTNSNIEYEQIHRVAYDLWRFALLAQNSDKPRSIAKDYIARVDVPHSDYVLRVETQQMDALNEEFRRWINAWKYGNENSQLKVKVLFINLFNSNKIENTLIFNKTGTNFKTDNIQLDHLEPDKMDTIAVEKYFEPSSKLPRETYTDSLGNFMIMDADSNNDKSTMPLQTALKVYDEMAGGHWLVKEIHELFNDSECGTDKKIDGGNYRTPNEEFFSRRKRRLICYFKALLNKRFDDDKVEVSEH